jgi:hypothetical protein
MRASTLEQEASRLDADMVELSLLVPQWQLAELEKLAKEQGLTLGQILRRLIKAFLQEP